MSRSVAEPTRAPAPPPAGAAAAYPLPSPAAPVMIRADTLGKRFKMYRRPSDRALEWLTLNRRTLHTDFWAVRGVSFEVRRGECLGIIGANGSGKSTLLKMITGALHPTEGAFSVDGRVLSLIELGTGIHPLLTGRANIANAARLLGFPPAFARDKMREIEEFAELGEFFDRPVRFYSSGMTVRLTFSMFACFRPEVFIVDEALSVGDVFFQQKCAARMRELLDGGMTMLFVSHDQAAVLNLCDRAILLEKGRPAFHGLPHEALNRYAAGLRGRPKYGPRKAPPTPPATAPAAPPCAPPAPPPAELRAVIDHDVIGERAAGRYGQGHLRIVAARITDAAGRDTMRVKMGEPLAFHVLIEAVRDVHAPRAGLQLVDRFNNVIFGAGTWQLRHDLPDLAAGQRILIRFDLTLDARPGEYTFGLGASTAADDNPNHGVIHDRINHLGPILILQDRADIRPFFGAARLPMRISSFTPADPT